MILAASTETSRKSQQVPSSSEISSDDQQNSGGTSVFDEIVRSIFEFFASDETHPSPINQIISKFSKFFLDNAAAIIIGAGVSCLIFAFLKLQAEKWINNQNTCFKNEVREVMQRMRADVLIHQCELEAGAIFRETQISCLISKLHLVRCRSEHNQKGIVKEQAEKEQAQQKEIAAKEHAQQKKILLIQRQFQNSISSSTSLSLSSIHENFGRLLLSQHQDNAEPIVSGLRKFQASEIAESTHVSPDQEQKKNSLPLAKKEADSSEGVKRKMNKSRTIGSENV